MEPKVQKDAVVNQLRQYSQTQVQEPSESGAEKMVDVETKEKIEMINRGLVFKSTQEDVSSATYFAKKYNLDY